MFDHRIRYANSAATELTGHSHDDLLGMDPGELVHPDSRLPSKPLTSLPSGTHELRFLTRDGRTKWVELVSSPLRSEGRRLTVAALLDMSGQTGNGVSLRMLEKAVQTTQIGVTITDPEGKILYSNPAEAEMHGYSVDELTGLDVRLFAPKGLWKPMTRAELSRMGTRRRESVNQRKDGGTFPVQLLSDAVLSESGEPIAVVTTAEDISHRKRYEEALLESEERYALAARGANDGLWDWDLKTDRMYLSPRWKSMLGFDEDEIGSASDDWFDRVYPEDVGLLRAQIADHLSGRAPQLECEYRACHLDGSLRWMVCRGLAVWDSDGQAVRMAGSQTDITKRKLAEGQLRHRAFHDSLTDLPNRALFMDRLEHAVQRFRRRDTPQFGVLFLDIDRFKLVNDTYGHLVGDELLKALARRLVSCLRPGDTIAHLSGDEFAILLDSVSDAGDTIAVATRIEDALRSPFSVASDEVFLSASIGIAVGSGRGDRPEQMLRDADTARYRAKVAGSCYQVFDTTMHAHVVALLQLDTGMRQGLRRSEFQLHYQPIVALKDRRITGFEALVRWQHPSRGLISAGEFVPVAEETGLISTLGEWVLRQACRQLHAWQGQLGSHPGPSVAVNLSAKEFLKSDQASVIQKVVEETGVNASGLVLELTESGLMNRADAAAELLEKLRVLGIRLAIDDFGTGYSSLSYLHCLPISTLKIDRSFVQGMHGSGSSEIIATIINLAGSLGMSVIAEGVETEQQARQLESLGCVFGQGFLFSRAVDAESASALLRRPAY